MPFAGFKSMDACVIVQKDNHPSWSAEQQLDFCQKVEKRVKNSMEENKETDSALQKHFEEIYAEMDTVDLDTILKNQPIAKEGVLEYSNAKKLKQWDNLKTFDSVFLPVVDDHPDTKNGKRGMWNKERIYGFAEVKVCPKEKKVLCADFNLDDDAPARNGYSIGYLFEAINKIGSINGSPFDLIQNIKEMDHVALTNYPRDSHALRRIDNDSNNTDNTEINNNFIGYDHFKTFFNRSSIQDQKKVKKKMADGDNDDQSGSENGTPVISTREAGLQKQIQKLESEKAFDATLKAKTEKLQKDLDTERAAKIKTQKENDSLKNALTKLDLDACKSEFNVDAKFFEKKNASYIKGALDFGRLLKKNNNLKPGETKPPENAGGDAGNGGEEFNPVNHMEYVWNTQQDCMVHEITGTKMDDDIKKTGA